VRIRLIRNDGNAENQSEIDTTAFPERYFAPAKSPIRIQRLYEKKTAKSAGFEGEPEIGRAIYSGRANLPVSRILMIKNHDIENGLVS
jgi:helix-turn-helix protein